MLRYFRIVEKYQKLKKEEKFDGEWKYRQQKISGL